MSDPMRTTLLIIAGLSLVGSIVARRLADRAERPLPRSTRIEFGGDGWHLDFGPAHKTYGDAVAAARAAGYTLDNGGWLHRMLMWNFNHHALEGYPGWEIENKAPAFVQLQHTRTGREGVESHKLACEWDDIAAVDFYQRDWTEDGIPIVHEGETYWSGWWFATRADRDKFKAWVVKRSVNAVVVEVV